MAACAKTEEGAWAVCLLAIWRDPHIRLDFEGDIAKFEIWAHLIAEELLLSALGAS